MWIMIGTECFFSFCSSRPFRALSSALMWEWNVFFNLFRLRFFGLVMIAIILYSFARDLLFTQQVKFSQTSSDIRCKLWFKKCTRKPWCFSWNLIFPGSKKRNEKSSRIRLSSGDLSPSFFLIDFKGNRVIYQSLNICIFTTSSWVLEEGHIPKMK